MEAWAVNRAVNSVKNDTEECIEPVVEDCRQRGAPSPGAEFLLLKQFVFFALSLTLSRHVLYARRMAEAELSSSNTRRALSSITRRPMAGNSCSTS